MPDEMIGMYVYHRPYRKSKLSAEELRARRREQSERCHAKRQAIRNARQIMTERLV